MSTLAFRPISSRAVWLVLAALALAAILALASPAQPAAASCGGTTTVGDETALNAAIAAFNAVGAGPCVFTIQLSGDIALTASTTPIDNNTAGVSLVIEGNGKTVNGQGTAGIRPFTLSRGTVTINQITITGGNATGTGVSGGGIRNGGGNLTVTNSTITGNHADGGGGGISNCESCNLTVQNCTISGNTAGRHGGGIEAEGTVNIDSSTLVNNQFGTGYAGGALMVRTGSTATVRNSILANSVSGDDCAIENVEFPSGPGTLNDGGYNLVETPGTGTGNPKGCADSLTGTGTITGQDPALGALANNGGPTQTHALNNGSPALEKIPSGTNGCGTTITTDQRGQVRPGTRNQPTNKCEIGAWEAQLADPTAVTLAAFTAQATGGAVTLAWETLAETELLGFHLYRTAGSGPAVRLNAELIPAQGGALAGASYTYTDAPGAGVFSYELEAVTVGGGATRHGPVGVQVGRPPRVYLPLVMR